MARNLEPSCKQCRREGEKLFLKGEKCYSEKCPLTRRGAKKSGSFGRRMSTYAVQLREKQKLKLMYGVLERQFRRFFELASRKEDPGKELLKLLERRLDNVVYRIGWAKSRKDARQLVNHGFILVNGKKVDIPSYLVNAGETIELRKTDKESIKQRLQNVDADNLVSWISLNGAPSRAKINRLPDDDDVKDIPINTTLIVEFYSK